MLTTLDMLKLQLGAQWDRAVRIAGVLMDCSGEFTEEQKLAVLIVAAHEKIDTWTLMEAARDALKLRGLNPFPGYDALDEKMTIEEAG